MSRKQNFDFKRARETRAWLPTFTFRVGSIRSNPLMSPPLLSTKNQIVTQIQRFLLNMTTSFLGDAFSSSLYRIIENTKCLAHYGTNIVSIVTFVTFGGS